MGDIEGDIRKGMVVLCKNCNIQREALELKYKDDKKYDYKDMFKGIFG